MKTIKLNIYNINELASEAKQKAYNNWLETVEYPWNTENVSTLDAFVEVFPVEITYWEYDSYNGFINFELTCNDDIAYLSGIRLMRYLYNNYFYTLYKGKYYSLWSKKEKSNHNPQIGKLKSRYSKVMFEKSCSLTGYYMDNEILEPIYSFLEDPKSYVTFHSLMKKCLNSWVNACVEDHKYCTSMDYFIEEALDGDYEYYEEGRPYA